MTVPHHRAESSLIETLRANGIGFTHRNGRTNCGFCLYDCINDMKKGRSYTWLVSPHIKEVIFGARFGKNSCAVVISTCPKCKRLSWEHFDLLGLLDRADRLNTLNKQAILDEICRRVRSNKKTWDEGTCHDCKYLTFAGHDYVNLVITTRCSKGCGPLGGDHKTYPEGEPCPRKVKGPDHKIDDSWYEQVGIFLDPPVFIGDVEFMKWKYKKAME